MNSGQAQASQAGHSMISSIKGKQKSKGALAASLVGSLLSLVPGAAMRKQGFKVTMQQVMDGKLGPGTHLTRIPWLSGKGPPKGFNIPEAGPGIAVSRSSGLTDPPVLEFSEATRGSPGPQYQEVNGTIGAHSGTASKTANQPNGSVAGSTMPRRSSEGTPASSLSRLKNGQDKSPTPKGTPVPKEGTTGVSEIGEAPVAGASAKNTRIKTAELTNVQSGEQQISPEQKVRSSQLEGIPRRNQVSHPGDLPGKGNPKTLPDAGNVRLENLSKQMIQSGKLARQIKRPHIGVKSFQANSRPTPFHEGEQSRLDGSLKQVNPEHWISNNGHAQKLSAQEFVIGQPPKTGLGNSSSKKVVKSRITNQQGLEINHASPDLQSRLSKIKPVPEHPGSSGNHEKQAATPKAVPAGSAGRHASSSAVESGRSAGSNSIYSLTDQNVSRDLMMGNDAPHRGFVKPVVVGIPEIARNRKPMGKEIPALMGQSLLSPTQSTNETSAALGSLARLTVSQYFRFVSSEQPNGVFTFNGGSLGNVQLSFRETDSGTVLQIVVESSEIRQVIQRTLPSLERDWVQEGLNFSDVNVEVGDAGYQWDSPGTADQTKIPTSQESAEALQVSPEIIEQAIKDYGYNTLEFVA
ncbi:hypothetical protein ACFL45_01790 [Candidatus Neomarinimicrobiota bacterium]